LWATANSGGGATFHFTLPTAAEVVKECATGTWFRALIGAASRWGDRLARSRSRKW
jgi:hypothetical protein